MELKCVSYVSPVNDGTNKVVLGGEMYLLCGTPNDFTCFDSFILRFASQTTNRAKNQACDVCLFVPCCVDCGPWKISWHGTNGALIINDEAGRQSATLFLHYLYCAGKNKQIESDHS